MKRGVTAVHFVGIGGVGMSALAELLHLRGHPVSGSDLAEGTHVRRLRALGIPIHLGHEAEHLGKADVVVRSSAISATNPELARARAIDVPVVGRGELLADLLNGHPSIVVAGAHGKTTTSSMIAHVLTEAGLDPTAVIGGRLVTDDGHSGGLRMGRDDLYVAECDESDGSFLHLRPTLAVITNVDPEHLDHYGNEAALADAFVQFTAGLPIDGACIVCIDDPGVRAILPRIERRRLSYAVGQEADLMARDVRAERDGMHFVVRDRVRSLGSVFLPLPGIHNVANALAALLAAREHAVPWRHAIEALATFRGVDRRFTLRGEANAIRVVDDYAHHPAELIATLAAARAAHSGRLIAVFQPHRYTRTRDFFDDFVRAFDGADQLIVTDIFAAGDAPIAGVTGSALCEAISARGETAALHRPDLEATLATLANLLGPGDLLLTLGAGDISSLGPRVLKQIEASLHGTRGADA